MSIVLNEYDWAENAIEQHELGRKPKETLRRVAGYYIENGDSQREARAKVENFLAESDPGANLIKWSNTLDKIVKSAKGTTLLRLDEIKISKPEMSRIECVERIQAKRLAFTLLCIAKYNDIARPNNNHWVNTPSSEIMRMANINTSVVRQDAMIKSLRDGGLIGFSNTYEKPNIQVLFIQDGEIALRVRDMRNLGYQYFKYYGRPYIECANCGITVKDPNPMSESKKKYCSSCAVELRTRQNVNAVMQRGMVN
jgi:hypothetical protein